MADYDFAKIEKKLSKYPDDLVVEINTFIDHDLG